MGFFYRKDLLIEFRAIPYSSSHVLQYRISPNQDLTYTQNVNWLFGLIKFNRKCKFNTNWHYAYHFLNYPSAYLYSEDHNYNPIFIKDKNELNSYKAKYLTVGEFYDMIDKHDQQEKKEWLKDRTKYLENNNIWE